MQALSGKIGQGAEQYQGQFLGSLLPGLAALLPSINQQGANTGTDYGAGNFLSNFFSSDPNNLGLSGFRAPSVDTDRTRNNYFQTAVAAPLRKQYEREILPRLNEAYAGRGAILGSRLADAKRRALSDMQDNMAAQLAGMARDDQRFQAGQRLSYDQLNMQVGQFNTQAQLQNQAQRLQGVGVAQGLQNAPLQRLGMLQGLYGPYQSREDALAQARYQEFLRTRPEASPWLQAGLSYINQSQQAVSAPYNPITQALGTGAQAWQVGGLLGNALNNTFRKPLTSNGGDF